MAKRGEGNNLIWQGRLHIGDEPGAYGDAIYVGLKLELPIEVIPFHDKSTSKNEITLILNAEGIEPDRGYAGHKVTVVSYGENYADETQRSRPKTLADARLDIKSHGELRLKISGEVPRYLSIRIEVDLEFDPGLYLETVITRLALSSSSHYAYLGYRYSDYQEKRK